MIYIPVILGAVLIIIGIALIIWHVLEISEVKPADSDPKGLKTTYPGIILIVLGAVMVIFGR